RLLRLAPGVAYRIDESPCGLDLVAPHEEGRIAADCVHQETLVGVRRGHAEGFGETQVEREVYQPRGAGARLLDHDPQLDSLVRLHPDHQAVRRNGVRRHVEYDMRHAPESDDDLREALRQPFAGAQIEGDASPAPVGDAELERNEGFGVAVMLADIVQVSGNGAAVGEARAILP